MEPTISEVFDIKEGCIIYSSEFFKREEHEIMHWRRALEEAILVGKPRLICPYCKQMVKLCGRRSMRGHVSYFSHLYDSDDCEIKTTTQLTKEEIEARKYGQVQESERHQKLKTLIAASLSGSASIAKGISDVQIEKRIKSKLPYLNWRRPDVVAQYQDMNIVFELQLSTTFLSVVVDRDIFYRLNGYFIIWVFNFEDNKEYINLYNLMCKDIYYGNKRNIFIFDQKAQQMSEVAGELFLRCQWLDADGKFTEGEYLTIDQLSFDNESCKPFYIDADEIYYAKHPEIQEKIAELEKSRQDIIDAIIERQHQEQARIKYEYDRLECIKDEIIANGTKADIYELDGKFGFEYNSERLTQAIYSEIIWDEQSQTFALKKGARIGVASQSSGIIVPCICTRIEKIDDNIFLIVVKKYWQILGSSSVLIKESTRDSFSVEKLENDCLIINITHPLGRSRTYHETESFLMFPNRETIKVQSFSKVDNRVTIYCHYHSEDFYISPDGYLYKNIIDDIDLIYSVEGLIGIYKFGCELVKPIYDEIKLNENNQFDVFQNMMRGVIDVCGKEIIPLDNHNIFPCGKNYYIVFNNYKYDLYNKFGKKLLSKQENKIQYVEPDAFIIQDKNAASLFNAEGNLLFSRKFCNFEPGFPGELKVTSVSNHRLIGILNFSGVKISGDKYNFKYPKENLIQTFSNNIVMIEADSQYWLRSSNETDLTDRYTTLTQLPNGFFLGNNEDIISPDATEIVQVGEKLKYLNEYLFIYDKGWGDNRICIINIHGHSIGHQFSNVYLRGRFVFTDYIMEIGHGWNSKDITLHGLYSYDGEKILDSDYNYIRLISSDLVLFSYKNDSAIKCISNGRKMPIISNNAIHKIATINGCTYYKIGRGGYYTLVNASLSSYGDFSNLSYDAKTNIIKGLDKNGKVYNALTKELIYVPKVPSIGEIVEGKVTGIKPYGVFIRFDSGHSGLLHISNISKNNKSISDFRKRQLLKVRITKIESTNKFNLDLVPD